MINKLSLVKSSQTKAHGFTLVEILVIAPIVILVIGAFIAVTLSMTGEVLTTRASDTLLYSVQDSLNRMSSDIRDSNNFLATNNVTLTAPQGIDNGTGSFVNVGGTNGPELILDSTATTTNPNLLTSQPDYMKDSPNACTSSAIQQNATLHYNIVYFVNNNTLYRRTLADSNFLTAGCSIPWQRPSCANGQIGALCKTNDEVLLTNVSSISLQVDYYTSPNDSSPVAGATSGTNDVRNTALQTTNTAQIQLSATTTVAGHDFTRSGTAKAVRQSTIATSQTPNQLPGYNTVPSAPVITAAYDSTSGVTFNWPMVSPAATYTIQYQLNGGSWTTASSNTTNTYYNLPMTTIYNGETIAVQVTASTQAGSSTAGTSTITTPLWNRFDYTNGWLDYPGYAQGGYTKTSAGLIVLRGLVMNTLSSGAISSVITVLPPAFRPSARLIFYTATNNSSTGNAQGRADIDASGNVIPVTGDAGWFSLDTVAYLPASAAMTAVSTFYNGWTNYGAGYAPMQYATDGAGRTVIEGLVNGGTYTDGTLIAAPPSSLLPSAYQHIGEVGAGTTSGIGVNVSGSGILSKGYGFSSPSWLSTNAVFYPASSAASWINLTLQNGWVYLGNGFSTPQYIKGSDGIVHLKGLLSSGTTTSGTIVTTLPAGYRPSQRLLYACLSAGAFCRFDILPTGEVETIGTVSNAWLSLDNIHFLGEQ